MWLAPIFSSSLGGGAWTSRSLGGGLDGAAVASEAGLGSTSVSGGDVKAAQAHKSTAEPSGARARRGGRRMGGAKLRPSPRLRKPCRNLVHQATSRSMARILHIEDDPGNRLLVRKLLQAAGHTVTEAVDGLEGVQLAISERPDLVLVDLNLPGLDGYEVTLRLRGEPSLGGVPIVAITAEGDRDTSLAVGCDGFLQKPIDAREFAETVEGYLRGRRELSSPHLMGERLRAQSHRIVAHLEAKVAELSHANERLLDLDRARKEFYRNISHELATPMTPIVGYLKLLVDEELGGVNTPQIKARRALDDCVRRLRALIDNLLHLSAPETGGLPFLHRPYELPHPPPPAVPR